MLIYSLMAHMNKRTLLNNVTKSCTTNYAALSSYQTSSANPTQEANDSAHQHQHHLLRYVSVTSLIGHGPYLISMWFGEDQRSNTTKEHV